MNRAVFVFAIVCVACALAVPIAEETIDNGPAPVALEDVAQDTTAIEAASNTELVRPKRFLLKKLALAKAGVLGLGALGVAGVGLAAVAAKSQQHPGNSVSYGSYYPSTPSYVYSASPTYLGSPGFSGTGNAAPGAGFGGIGGIGGFGPIGGGLAPSASATTGVSYGPPAQISSAYGAPSGYAAPAYNGHYKTVYVVCD